jgi:hypothetical protein
MPGRIETMMNNGDPPIAQNQEITNMRMQSSLCECPVENYSISIYKRVLESILKETLMLAIILLKSPALPC